MLIIRLSRVGKTKQPSYRLIVSEKTKDPWGRYLENLGFYNPRANPPVIQFKIERIKHWLEKGAQLSDTIHNLLVEQKIIAGKKRKKVKISKKRATKMEEKKKVGETATAAPPIPAVAVTEEPVEIKS